MDQVKQDTKANAPEETRATAPERMWEGIREFMLALEALPGWREWRRKKLEYTLHFDDPDVVSPREEMAEEFCFTEDIEKQHAVIMGFLALSEGIGALKECEHYFRRYPFRGLPVSKHRHFVNICEMYVSRFYEIRERVRNVLDAVNVMIAPKKLEVGKFLKTFDKIFEQEIRARHCIHHRERFDDVAINRMFLAQVFAVRGEESLALRGVDTGLVPTHHGEYRKLTHEWVRRVRRRGKLMDDVLETVAKAIVENCDFVASKEEDVTLVARRR